MRIELFQAFTIALSFITTLITVNTFFNNKNKEHQEESLLLDKKITLLEVKQQNLQVDITEHKRRLDIHDKQNENIIRLTEKIAALTEKVDEINQKLEGEIK